MKHEVFGQTVRYDTIVSLAQNVAKDNLGVDPEISIEFLR